MEKNNPSFGYAVLDCSHKITHKQILPLTILVIVLSLFLTGCVTFNDPESSQEYNTDFVGKVDTESILGQTFISRRPRLNGITIWITIPSNENNPATISRENIIRYELFHSPSDTTPIYTNTVVVPSAGDNIPTTVNIPATGDVPDLKYYLKISSSSGVIQINGRNEDAYPRGQAFINDQPINADIAFRLSYDYTFSSLIQDIGKATQHIWIVFPLLIVLWLPGWLVLDFSRLRNQFDIAEQTALSIGISIAIIPIFMLWTSTLKLRLTREVVLVILGILVVIFIIRLIFNYFSLHKSGIQKVTSPFDRRTIRLANIRHFGPSLILFIIFIFTLAIRLIMVRDLATPAWVDSIHHALLTRLIMSNGGFATNFLPYLDIAPANYHLGFHSVAAIFTWLSNLRIDQSLLILGQVLNATSIFSVYLLAKTLTRSTIAGLFAAIITGFFTPMPAYYTSWSRYTELTGLVILPVAFVFFNLLANERRIKNKVWIILLGAITSAGLFMVHYRVVIFLLCLILSHTLVNLPNRQGIKKYIQNLLMIFLVAASSILLTIPWFIPTVKNAFIPAMNTSGIGPFPIFQDFPWAYLTAAFGKQTLVLACLGLLLGLIRLKRFSFLVILWVILLFFFANLAVLNLPGSGLISSLSVGIMLFMPVSILGGYFIDETIAQWKILIPPKAIIPSLVMLIFVVGWIAFSGSKQLLTIINPITILSRKADIPAIAWIDENIPEDESIVINPFSWGYGIFAGGDGGYWISPLTGRSTIPPPVLYGLGNQVQKINDQTQKIIDLGSSPQALSEYLDSIQVHYIYLGAKGGVLSPEKLQSSGFFSQLYHQDGVWVFSTKP